jgi:hypothetical protein
MMIFNRILVVFLLFISSIFASTPTETQFTSGKNIRTSCKIECPPMKAGFIARMDSFNYQTGDTVCSVYDLQNIYHSIATVTNQNKFCTKDLINPSSTAPINTNTSMVNSNLEALRTNIKSYYTAGSTSYINLPKYMVAGLMADDNIIDISSSISNNRVTLNSGYTYYPSLTKPDTDSITDATLISFTKDALANSVTFVMNFFSISDKTLLSFKVTMFLFVVALSLILTVSQKATKKVSKLQDHDDITERVLLGVGSILVFFLTLNKISTPNGQISQTGYQQLIRPMIYLGIDTADKLAENVTASVLKYKFGEVGLSTEKELNSIKNQKYILERKQDANKLVLDSCAVAYNEEELKAFNKNLGINLTYPPSENIKRTFMDSESTVTFYTKKFMNSESFIKKGGIPTVTMCFNAEKNYLINNSEIDTLTKKITNYEKAITNKDLEKQINTITNLTYRNMAEMGFASVINVATTNIAFEHLRLDAFDDTQREERNIDTLLQERREATGYEVPIMANESGSLLNAPIQGVQWVIGNAPYLMVFGGIRTTINDMINDDKGKNKDESESDKKKKSSWKDSVLKVVGNFPVGGIIVTKLASFLKDSVFLVLPSLVAIAIGIFILSIAPLIGIMASGFLVISFYFLSIVVLYTIIPFASVFAFSTGNLDIIKNLIKHTFLLSIKPILIVVSVLLAIFAYTMFSSLNETLIASMFEPLYAMMAVDGGIANPINAIYHNTVSVTLVLFLKGLFHLASSLITTVACFYLVFNGANIILDILGMRDGGFDVSGVIGDKVEGKSSKMNQMV